MTLIGRRRRARSRWAVLGAVTALLVLTLGTVAQAATTPAPLSGSGFQGNDGNLIYPDGGAGTSDWQTIGSSADFTTGVDLPTGNTDNSFGQGSKEDDPNVSVVTGSIPPNKNDLTRFYVASEYANGKNFLYLAWERAVNLGNANLDFEINRNPTSGWSQSTTGPVTINRSAGDLLVTYDFAGSGTPTLGLNRWITSGSVSQCYSSNTLPCWGNHVDLTTGVAEGAVNTAAVLDPFIGGTTPNVAIGNFGEAAINLTDSGVFPAGTCVALGSAFVKSRSSSSFTASLKDFVAPVPVNVTNCGTVIIRKATSPHATGDFFPFTDNLPGTQTSFSLSDGSSVRFDGVTPGPYGVTEGTYANWKLTDISCTSGSGSPSTSTGDRDVLFSVSPSQTVDCTFTNTEQLGAIKITKTSSKDASTYVGGATFSITDGSTGVWSVTTGQGGVACLDQLPFGTYGIREAAAPAGWAVDDASTHTVTVNSVATCGSGNESTYSATDTPTSNVRVLFQDGGSGTTSATSISCQSDNTTGTSTTLSSPPTGWDAGLDLTGILAPTTVHCTIVIDP